MEDDEQRALETLLDSIQHMTREEMKSLLLEDANDPEYVATVEALFSQEDISHEVLVECLKEMLVPSPTESLPSTSASKPQKQAKTKSSSEDAEEVRRRAKKRKLPKVDDKSAESDDTVDLVRVKNKVKKQENSSKAQTSRGRVLATVSLESSSDSETNVKKDRKGKSGPEERKENEKSHVSSSGKGKKGTYHVSDKASSKDVQRDKDKEKRKADRDEKKGHEASSKSDTKERIKESKKASIGIDEKKESKYDGKHREESRVKVTKSSHKDDHGEKKKREEKSSREGRDRDERKLKSKEHDKSKTKKEDDGKREKAKEKSDHGESNKSSRPEKEHEKSDRDKVKKPDPPETEKISKAEDPHSSKINETKEQARFDDNAGDKSHGAVSNDVLVARSIELSDSMEEKVVNKEPTSITDMQEHSNVNDLPTSSGLMVESQKVLDITEDAKRTGNEAGNSKCDDNLALTERRDAKSNAVVIAPTADAARSSAPVGQKSETIFLPEFKVRVPQVPLVDPDFRRYRKDFKLKRVKIMLYDVCKQKRDMQEGDQVHRRLLHEEERKRKKEKHKLPERKEKYSERGTRILPFEKRPENADLYARKREIVREKPKTETPTEKQKRLVQLHKKVEREKEERKKAAFHSEFRIPKGKKFPSIVENMISSTTATPLAPPVKVNKMHFDKRRITTTTAKEDSWGLTPEERAALEKMDKVDHKKYDEPILLDDGLCDYDVPECQNDLFPTKEERAAEQDDEQDSLGYEPSDTPPSPVKECEVNDLSRGVIRLLFTETCIELADEHASHADVIMQKCGKWFRGVEHEPYYQTCPSIPEQNEEEYYTLMDAAGDDNESVSSVGNVSNPDGEDDLQDNEITSTAMDPDQLDEFCGAALLNAKLRVKAGDTPDCFKNILEVRRGLNYDKANFQAKCTLCDEQLTDKRHLGAHIRSSKHRINLAETSLQLIGMSGKVNTDEVSISSPAESKTHGKVDPIRQERKEKEKKKGGEEREKDGLKSQKEKERVIAEPAHAVSPRRVDSRRHRSRSRSKSPRKHRRSRSRSKGRRRSRSRDRRSRSRSRGRRSRSRSPHRRNRRSRSRSYSPRGRHHKRSKSRSPSRHRRHSRDRKDEPSRRVERKRSRSPKVTAAIIQKLKDIDNAIFKEKLMLEASGKWTNQLESRWKLKEEEEEKMKRFFEKKRKNLEERPEEHPAYSDEWTKFWERRYQELTEQGKDAENYDYIPEWKLYWKDFSDNALDNEYAIKMQEVRKKYGMDLETLRALNVASAPPPATPPVQFPVPPVPIFPYSMVPPPPIVPPPMVPLAGIPAAILGSAGPVMPVTPLPPTCVAPVVYPSAVPQLGVQSNVAVAGSSSNATPVNPKNIITDSVVPTVSGKVGVDYTTKSMSISSGSSNGGKSAVVQTASVTIDDVKNTWLNLTGQKISAAVVEAAKSVASNGSSRKSQGFDYDGLDVVQTLRLMLNLEDELSFLAPQVQNFYQEAEKLEAEKTRKSFNLLKNEEFAYLLKQCRDKFHAILRANVSSSEVMKKLNFASFALNALLESSACKKLRFTAPVVEHPEVSSSSRPTAEAVKVQRSSADALGRAHRNPIADALEHLPQRVLAEISTVIASSLIAQGKDRLSEGEITTNLLSIFAPILAGGGSPSARQILSPAGSNVSIASLHSDRRVETAPTGFKLETGARASGPPVSTSRIGGLEDEVGYGMSSFLPGHGGGPRFGRNGSGNPTPHNQDDLLEAIIQNISFATNTKEPGFSRYNCNQSLEHSSQETQDQKLRDSVKERNKSHNEEAATDEGGIAIFAGRAEEPYDPERASFSSGEILDDSENIQAGSSRDPADGPCLPPGILSLIQKEREAKTGGECSTGDHLVHSGPQSKSRIASSSKPVGTSSLSSITEVGTPVAKRSKRHRRKSKKIKEDTKYKRSRSRKRQGRHSRSPSMSLEREEQRRRSKKSRQDRMTRRTLSPGGSYDRCATSDRRHSRDEERRRHRKGPKTSNEQRRNSHNSEVAISRSRRHRRSKKKKRFSDQSGDAKVAGVSKHFWHDNGSSISSEDNIPDSKQEALSKSDGGKPYYRRRGSGALVGTVEDGEVISSSETDFSHSSVSQQQIGNKPDDEPIEVVSEEENWGDAHVSHV